MVKTCTRVIGFDAAHRLINHEGKCRTLHGHRYSAEITCSAASLDSVGRLVDFGAIKNLVGGWIDTNWDHVAVVNPEDYDLVSYLMKTKQPFYPLISAHGALNPTAENMAQHLFDVCGNLLRDHSVTVSAVRLYETPNCWADVKREKNEN